MHRLFGGLLALTALAVEPGAVRGTVVDSNGGVIPQASIRVLSKDLTSVVARGAADSEGAFLISGVGAGEYTVEVGWRNAFRARFLRDLVVKQGATTNAGEVRLDFLSCDAPEVNCDEFTAGGCAPSTPQRVSRTYVTAQPEAGVDLGFAAKCKSPVKVNLILQREGDGGLWLIPAGKLQVSRADVKPDSFRYMREPLRIDRLGPGHDFWVRVPKCGESHVFFVNEVTAGTTELRLWRVTR